METHSEQIAFFAVEPQQILSRLETTEKGLSNAEAKRRLKFLKPIPQRPLFSSRPGRLFLIAEASVAVITFCIPYTPLASWLGFVSTPPALLSIAIGITILYGIGMEIVKVLFYCDVFHGHRSA